MKPYLGAFLATVRQRPSPDAAVSHHNLSAGKTNGVTTLNHLPKYLPCNSAGPMPGPAHPTRLSRAVAGSGANRWACWQQTPEGPRSRAPLPNARVTGGVPRMARMGRLPYEPPAAGEAREAATWLRQGRSGCSRHPRHPRRLLVAVRRIPVSYSGFMFRPLWAGLRGLQNGVYKGGLRGG